MKEQFDRDTKNLLKKNEETIAKLQGQHRVAMRELTADQDRLKQLLDPQKRECVCIKSKFERDKKNLLKKNDQHEAALRKVNEKHHREVSALKNEIKRLKALDQPKKAEDRCDQVKDENARLKQKITQLEAENASVKEYLDRAIVQAKKTAVKEDESRLRERLVHHEAEIKKMKSDMTDTLDSVRK
ncbi:unnamed protein product, partial [Callosobruchus maculatus]